MFGTTKTPASDLLLIAGTREGQRVLATVGSPKTRNLRRDLPGVIVGYTTTDMGPSHYVLNALVRLDSGEVVETHRVRTAPVVEVVAAHDENLGCDEFVCCAPSAFRTHAVSAVGQPPVRVCRACKLQWLRSQLLRVQRLGARRLGYGEYQAARSSLVRQIARLA